jgi:bifunctional DNase/RNase
MDAEIKLTITGLVYNQTVVGTYGLVLSETEGNRRFSVMIGEPEAQSIALKLNGKKPPRPLTHDLIFNLLNLYGSKLEKVLIYNMVNDVFYSELHIKNGENSFVLDARTSDAVALAVRSDSPIYIKSGIIDIVGTVIDSEPEAYVFDKDEVDAEELTNDELDLLSLEDLNEILNMAVKEEKYELAVNIRDAIKRKEEK